MMAPPEEEGWYWFKVTGTNRWSPICVTQIHGCLTARYYKDNGFVDKAPIRIASIDLCDGEWGPRIEEPN